ncbi:MAG: NPCBM/NEW2 domain-containing protein [Verrucomicrobiales bacterium]
MSRFLHTSLAAFILSLSAPANPADLDFQEFAGPDITPSPACLCAAPTGEVYVGVDLLGSLGKGPGKGRIIRLVDSDHDGKADQHSVFAEIDNPRGLISVGDQLFVLHTVIPAEVGKMTGMHLSVLEDKDGDGKADGPPKILVRDISTLKSNQERGADHTTNGISLGIDGWIYIAVGDFGFVNAQGTDGTTMTMLGGGIVRVRPDGSEMEVYTHGLRNIYDVAIDPLMNIYTRGNTNDGGGWNIRFIHQIQAGQYGYPVLFKHFTHEIIPALVDLGGGSGTGAIFMDEPTWPEKYNQVPMMADWGRNQVYIHRVTPDGPSFTQEEESFIGLSQPSDLDVDGSGQLYIAAWAGAGYKGNPERGFVQRVVPKNWTYQPFPDLTSLKADALVKGLATASAKTRLATQQEILRRTDQSLAPAILAIAADAANSAAVRTAALFTYKQLLGAAANPALIKLSEDPAIQELTLRALADRKSQVADLPLAPFQKGLKSENPRVRAAAAIALGRLGRKEAAQDLLSVAVPPPHVEKVIPTPQPPLFVSQKIGAKESQDFDIDLKGAKNLYLVVDEGGDGSGGDHGSWFDPVLVDASGKEIPLTSLKWQSATQGWGKTLVNGSPTGAPLKRADGKALSQGIGTHANSVIHYELPADIVRFKGSVGLASTQNTKGKTLFKVFTAPPIVEGSNEGPHATPNSDVIIPHLAIKALTELENVEALLAAIDSQSRDGALRALQHLHQPAVVDGLIAKFQSAGDSELKNKILLALARLYTREAPYDGSWWWSTRPDTRGPYYNPIMWEKSGAIEALFRQEWDAAAQEQRDYLAHLATKHRMNLAGIGLVEKDEKDQEPKVGEMSIEDVMLALDKLKGDPAAGGKLMKTQACAACHSIAEADPKRGPDLNHIGSVLNREAIAEAILKPDATIAENWVDLTTKDGTIHQGTLVKKDDKEVIIRNIAGIPTTLKAEDVASLKKSASTLMGPHLLDALTMKQFADVIAYLHSLK